MKNDKLMIRSFLGRLRSEQAYHKFQTDRGEHYQRIISSNLAGKHVLDVGCHLGGIGSTFKGSFNVGIDIDKKRIYRAAEFNDNSDSVFMVGDATCMPYKNESFEIILLFDVIEHVKASEELISECARVLKRGGMLCVNFGSYNTVFGGHLILPYVQYLPNRIAYFLMEKFITSIETPKSRELIDIGSLKRQHETLNRISTSRVSKMLLEYFTVESETATLVIPHLKVQRTAAMIPDFLCIGRFYICKK